MKKYLLSTIIFFIASHLAFSQGTVRGKITDKNGETLIGATVVLKSNTSVGSVTDFDGNYSLKIADSTAQTLIITFISYKTLEVNVHPVKNEVLIKNFVLQSSANEVKAVEVVGKAVKAKSYYMEKVKLNSATTLDYVSSETMKKAGDANVTSAVTRVSGVSTNGAFITVRGIGDRYVKTTINGSRIPTLDPFTNNIKLDLFPSSLVDNVIITKTASPDLPGDWAGAYLSIETKDYPEELSINEETTIGYNNQSTLKNVITSERSSTDWLGYDNSFRDRSHTEFHNTFQSPTQYQEFAALGLAAYFNSMGVNSTNWYSDGNNGNNYFKLGLVQLGLLAPALINDANSFNQARDRYTNGSYKADAFAIINADAPKTGHSFPANWNTIERKTPLNFSQSFSVGNQVDLFGKPLGFIVGLKYNTANQTDPNYESSRVRYDGGIESHLNGAQSVETNGWSALINLAYKLNSNNSVSFLFMPNLSGSNKVRHLSDQTDKTTVITLSQFYEQRRQLVYQFKSEHYLPGPQIKIDFNASYTKGKSTAPDFKNLQYWKNEDGSLQIGGTIGDGIKRYYRYLKDDLLDSRLSLELPIDNKPNLVRKLKLGGAYQNSKQRSDEDNYEIMLGSHIGPLFTEDIDAYLNLNQYNVSSGTDAFGVPYSAVNAYYLDNTNDANHRFGQSTISAGLVMVDYSFNPRLRFSGGVRLEHAIIKTDVVAYDSLGYERNDPRRNYSDGDPLINPAKFDQTSWLPSANIIYKLKNVDDAPINLRFNYSQTVARPSIRELSDIAIVDYEFKAKVYGNSELKMVHVNNYDLRFESYFKSNDNISVSVFYKDFKNHIELVNSGGYSWQNVDKSHVYGLELEGRKVLTKHFDLTANITLANSFSKVVRTTRLTADGATSYIPTDTTTRTMFGQAPYVINGILSYNADSIGLVLTLSYNLQGPRLVVASDNASKPDVFELPRHLFDFKVSKKLGKHFSASFTVRDLLGTSIVWAYKTGSNSYDVNYEKYKYGTNYLLSLAYKL